jgi:hypothetical protein
VTAAVLALVALVFVLGIAAGNRLHFTTQGAAMDWTPTT